MKEKLSIKDQLAIFGCPIRTEHEMWSVFYDEEVTKEERKFVFGNFDIIKG